MMHSLRLSRQFIIIRRGRLRWLLEQEQMFHHRAMGMSFDGLPDNATGGPQPGAKNSKPLRDCTCCEWDEE